MEGKGKLLSSTILDKKGIVWNRLQLERLPKFVVLV